MCTISRGRNCTAPSATVDAAPDSAQRVFADARAPIRGAERLFFIDLTLDRRGRARSVSRNFYWVPGTLTTFDWPKTDYTHTPAARHEDLTALANLPQATVAAPRRDRDDVARPRDCACVWTTLRSAGLSAACGCADRERRPHRPGLLVRQLDRACAGRIDHADRVAARERRPPRRWSTSKAGILRTATLTPTAACCRTLR